MDSQANVSSFWKRNSFKSMNSKNLAVMLLLNIKVIFLVNILVMKEDWVKLKHILVAES